MGARSAGAAARKGGLKRCPRASATHAQPEQRARRNTTKGARKARGYGGRAAPPAARGRDARSGEHRNKGQQKRGQQRRPRAHLARKPVQSAQPRRPQGRPVGTRQAANARRNPRSARDTERRARRRPIGRAGERAGGRKAARSERPPAAEAAAGPARRGGMQRGSGRPVAATDRNLRARAAGTPPSRRRGGFLRLLRESSVRRAKRATAQAAAAKRRPRSAPARGYNQRVCPAHPRSAERRGAVGRKRASVCAQTLRAKRWQRWCTAGRARRGHHRDRVSPTATRSGALSARPPSAPTQRGATRSSRAQAGQRLRANFARKTLAAVVYGGPCPTWPPPRPRKPDRDAERCPISAPAQCTHAARSDAEQSGASGPAFARKLCAQNAGSGGVRRAVPDVATTATA